ncbi:winged helix-turn-helix transcriptional regulator [Paenibacillus bovis]|uniref:HxlR family transcriptional regulator n=1 Tax=Paenibacillus bovis TaxID=1616788 RepID=A0A172ZBX4_9BACL|nr:helix-turn-helix domain-containing protein [Paenibacillus bovis]ANF95029.1 HxlR family transcriptional regulator [Paenibacillus bovis]
MGISDLKDTEMNIQDTPFGYTMSIIGGKWKMVILYLLAARQPVRFNEMHRQIGAITYKILSAQLKELEADGLVERKEYPQIPPKVEYSLTPKGQTLLPVMEQLCEWGAQNRQPDPLAANNDQ